MSIYGRDNLAHFQGDQREYIAACANAFHGREIPTDKITPGVFWDAIKVLEAQEAAELAWANCPDCEGSVMPELCGTCFPAHDDARLERRALLDKLGLKP